MEFRGPAVQPDLRDVSQAVIRPTGDISPSVITASGAVDVDDRAQRPSQPHFVGDTRKFLPIYVDVHAAPSNSVDIPTRQKRLYAAAQRATGTAVYASC